MLIDAITIESKAGIFAGFFLFCIIPKKLVILRVGRNFRKGATRMIKGVNRNVIEVNRPDSAYFERAVLYVRPEVKDVPAKAAQRETAELFGTTMKQHKSHGNLFLFFLGMAVSAGIFWIFFSIKP